MKRFLTLLSAFLFITYYGMAQDLKIGYLQEENVFAKWPKTKKVDEELSQYKQSLTKQYQDMYLSLQTKLGEYQKNHPRMSENQRMTTEKNLLNLEYEIEQFQANWPTLIAEKNMTLLSPLQDTWRQTIEQVASEKGYTHILNYGSALIFTNDTSGDISVLVAQKLGFTLSQ